MIFNTLSLSSCIFPFLLLIWKVVKKKILFFLIIFGLGLVYLLTRNNPVWAQGNCECHYVGSDCVPNLDPDVENCDDGLSPMCGALCSCSCGIPPTPTPTPTPPPPGSCDDAGGSCAIIKYGVCPDGYQPNPVSGPGEMGCSGLQRCCLPLASGCETWNPVTGCPNGYIRCPDAETVCCADTNDCPVYTPPSGGGGPIQTAIGPIDVTSPTGFVEAILDFALGIAGGIAILLIIYGAFLYLTSGGNPEKVQAGKELITNAIIGLLVIIFAVFIMEMVTYQVLKIFQ